ncbi:MAG: calcium/sodium antiporter [Thermodesulfobacteriota bacterium]
MLINILLFLVGLLFLYTGATWVVKGGSTLAVLLGVRPLLVGITVVAFATSTPELIVSVIASLKGSSDLALGNIVGSNIANIGLILGLSGLLMPLHINISFLRKELPILIAVSLLFYVLSLDLNIGLTDGFILLTVFTLFIVFAFITARKEGNSGLAPPLPRLERGRIGGKAKILLAILAGMGALFVGGELLIRASISMAKEFGISEIIIGLTLVSLGSSLPELATAIVASLQKENDICIGNLIGSNIFNILFVGGLAAVVSPINVAKEQLTFYLPVMLVYTVSMMPLMKTGLVLKRWEGALLLATYVGFLIYLIG